MSGKPQKPQKPKAPEAPKVEKPWYIKLILKNLGAFKQLVVVGLASAVAAGVSVGLMLVFSVVNLFPSGIEIPVAGIVVGSLVLAFLTMFAFVGVLGVVYVFFGQQVTKSAKQTRNTFKQLPAIGKGLVMGIPVGLAGAAGTLLVDIYAWEGNQLPLVSAQLPTQILLVVAGGLAGLLGAGFMFQHFRRERTVAEGLKIVGIAAAIGSVFTILTGFVDQYVLFFQQLPGYLYLVVLGTVVPVSLALIAPEYYNERGWVLSAASRKSGFAQQRQIQGPTIAVALGFAVALMLATIVNLILDGLLIPVLAFIVFWVGATVGAIQWFKRRSDARLDLVITNVRNRSTGDRRRELAIRNEGNYQVDLRDAKIRDTEGDLFRTSLDVVLAPGQTTTFDIPPAFALATTEDDVSVGSWSITRSNPVPVIVTREGVKYELWMEEERHKRVREHGNVREGSGLDVDVDRKRRASDDGSKGRRRGKRRGDRDGGKGGRRGRD